jgi:hypothetical protein
MNRFILLLCLAITTQGVASVQNQAKESTSLIFAADSSHDDFRIIKRIGRSRLIDERTQRKFQKYLNSIPFAGSTQSYQGHTPTQQPPPHENPLLKQASMASIGALFLLLVWRTMVSYELADQFATPFMRLITVTPTIAILVANLLGFVGNVMKPLNYKNVLKFILALNVGREVVEAAYNAIMLIATGPNSIIPREVYFGRFFMNIWWGFLCLSFSKSRWVLQTLPTTGSGTFHQRAGDGMSAPRQQF